MATAGGTEHSDVEISQGAAPGTPAYALCLVDRDLHDAPGTFDFFQAVRLLTRLRLDREPVGHFVPPDREAVRFSVNPALSFPPSQIHRIEWDGDVPRIVINFMGLTGPMGTLPYSYSELITDRLRNKDRTLSEFFDLFNHRAISLFYQAWEKYHFSIAFERDGQDRVSEYLMSLIGLGTEGLQDRLAVPDQALLYYTGLLGLQPRSASALRNMLEDYFDVPVEVEQFVGSWQELSPSDQCIFGDGDSFAEQLAVGAVAGDAIWDRQSRIRLKFGPLDRDQYLGFLPAGSAWEPLRSLAKFFCGEHVEIEVQLFLKRDEVPRCELGEDSAGGPRLGWFTWMKSGSGFDRTPGDSILLLT
jgi:type VI secretion system protein ImpH